MESVTSVGPTSCKLQWVPIPADQHRGVLLGYRIVYTSMNHSTSPSNVTASPLVFKYFDVNGLTPYTYYLIKIAGFTSKGDGNYSRPVECLTMEDSECRFR